MKITLKDIAKDTGLSISTVSRALAKSGKISLPNVKKVFESAQRLNYPVVSNMAPFELRNSVYIALVTTFHPGEFYASFFNGFALAAKGSNIHFGLFNVCLKNDCTFRFLESIKKNQFDAAVLFLPGLAKQDYLDIINRVTGFPMISAAPIATPVMDSIVFDNYSGGHLMGKHFHEQGFRKIGIIQGPTSELETHLRKNGLINYCEQNELELVMTYHSDYNIASGKGAYEHYKGLKIKPEVIFACNDALATGFMHSAARDGLSIPTDVAIAGYDDIPICEYHNPTLTSIRTPYESLGKNILDHLSNQLSNTAKHVPHSGSTKLIPVSLMARESTVNA